MREDLRLALRRLRQAPGWSLLLVLTLALGIGANTAVFSVLDRAVLRPLPFPEAGRLITIRQETDVPGMRISLAYAGLAALAPLRRDLASLSPYTTQRFNVAGGIDPAELTGVVAPADLFAVLGVQPQLGRLFGAGEARAPVVVLGHRAWLAHFGGDPGVVGRQLALDGASYTVVGVLPAGVAFPDGTVDLWVPIGVAFAADPGLETGPERNHFTVVARLREGVTPAQAMADLHALRAMGPDGGTAARGFVADRTLDEAVGNQRSVLLMLLGAAAVVLLIACANAAALLIARATGRQREIALRQVLGAGRGRIVRQLLVESLLVASLAGAAGLLLGRWGLDLLRAAWPAAVQLPPVTVDGRLLLLTLLLSLATGVGFGLIPALRASRVAFEPALRAAAGQVGSGPQRRALRVLVVAELALALVLLVGAGLLLRSLGRVLDVDPGYDASHVVAARLRLTPSRYPTRAAQDAFFVALRERLAQHAGLEGAALSTTLPLTGGWDATLLNPHDVSADNPDAMLLVPMVSVDGDYFRTLRLPLLAGRGFAAGDARPGPEPVVVNRALARKLWGDADPLGRHLPLAGGGAAPEQAVVVGVAADQHYRGIEDSPDPMLYLPLGWSTRPLSDLWLLVRSPVDPATVAGEIREAVRALDPGQPLGDLVALQDVVAGASAGRRFSATVIGLFAGLALFLAVTGILGVTSYTLQQRTRELGVRMVLGADPGTVQRMVMVEALGLVAVGGSLGLAGAAGVSRLLRGMLFGVGPDDPAVYLGVTLLLGTMVLLGSWLPARRAARVDPMEALRAD